MQLIMELLRNIDQTSKNDVALAGGKGASLGEMTQAGLSVPPGFVILSSAFEKFLEETDLNVEIEAILDSVNHKEMHTVENASEKIQALILEAEMPKDLAQKIEKFFKNLGAKHVAVRSSATVEDSASAAWAGQLESYLNTTEESLLENIKKCWASLFTPRAIFYRFEKDLHKQKISVAVVVQKMVDSEKSGIAFSVHPVTQDKNQLIIEAGFGLGEAIVSGQITPDSYVVEKQPRRIIDKNVQLQSRGLYRAEKAGNELRDIPKERGKKQVLSDKEILELSEIILHIENHYGFPCDVEWAFEQGKFYIVQSRPITTLDTTSKASKVSAEYFITTQYKGSPPLYLADLYINEAQRSFFHNLIGYFSAILHISLTKDEATNYVAIQDKNAAGLDENYGYKFWQKEDNYKRYILEIKKIISETHTLYKKYEQEYKGKEGGVFLKEPKNIAEFLSQVVSLNARAAALHFVTEEKLLESIQRDLLNENIDNSLLAEYLGVADHIITATDIDNRINILILDAQRDKSLATYFDKNPTARKNIEEMIDEHGYINWTLLGGEIISIDTIAKLYNQSKQDKKYLEHLKDGIEKYKELLSRVNKKQKAYESLQGRARYLFEVLSNLPYFRFENQTRMLILANIFNQFNAMLIRNYNIDENDFKFYKIEDVFNLLTKSVKLSPQEIDERKSAWCYMLSEDGEKIEFLSGNEVIKNRVVSDALGYLHNLEATLKKLRGTVGSFPDKNRKIIDGEAYVVSDMYSPEEELRKMPNDKVLIITQTYPNYVPYMRKARAIVADVGGITSHAAIVSRELKIPCIVGTKLATKKLKNGDNVRINLEDGTIEKVE